MKRLLLFLLCAVSARATDVQWNFSTITGSPQGNRLIYLTCLTSPFAPSTNIFLTDRTRFTNDSSGSLIVSNLATPATYLVELVGPYRSTMITNTFPATNGLINAASFLSSSTNLPGALVGYSMSAADQRFMLKSGGSAANPTLSGKVILPAAGVGYVWTQTNADGSGEFQLGASGVSPTLVTNVAQQAAGNATNALGSAAFTQSTAYDLAGVASSATNKLFSDLLADLQSATNTTTLAANGMATKVYADASSQAATNRLMIDASNTFEQITDARALTNNLTTIAETHSETNIIGAAFRQERQDSTNQINSAILAKLSAATNTVGADLRQERLDSTNQLNTALLSKLSAATNTLGVDLRQETQNATNTPRLAINLAGIFDPLNAARDATNGNVQAKYATNAPNGVQVASTNLATTSLAGLSPKLPNDSSQFLDGTGNYSTPASLGGGDVTTAQLQSATNVNTLDANGMAKKTYVDTATNNLNTALVAKILAATNTVGADLRQERQDSTNQINIALVAKILAATNTVGADLRQERIDSTNQLNTALVAKILAATNTVGTDLRQERLDSTNQLNTALVAKITAATNTVGVDLRQERLDSTNQLNTALVAKITAATNTVGADLRQERIDSTNQLNTAILAKLTAATNTVGTDLRQEIQNATNTARLVINLGSSFLSSGSVLPAANFPALTGDITTSAGALATTLKNTGTSGTYTKTTFDAQGRETSGASAVLASADFANQGTTTTILHGNASGNPSFAAVDVSSAEVTGVLKAAAFPALTGDITTSSGALATTLKNTGSSGTYTKVTFDAQGRETSGTTLSAGDIPAIAESGVTSLVTDLSQRVGTNDSRNLVLTSATNNFGTDVAASMFWGSTISQREYYSTNNFPATPGAINVDWRFQYQFISTNANFTIAGFINQSNALVNTTIVSISNSAASSITATYPAGLRSYGTNASTSGAISAGKVLKVTFSVDPHGTNLVSSLQSN